MSESTLARRVTTSPAIFDEASLRSFAQVKAELGADAGHVQVDHVKDLPDDDFLATMKALGPASAVSRRRLRRGTTVTTS